jgi:hypothetical protein
MEQKTIVIDNNLSEQEYDLPAPSPGKVWRCKINGALYTGTVLLAKIFCMNGKWLDKPIVETVDDFELIDLNTEENE